MIINAGQSILGRMLTKSLGFRVMLSSETSSAFLGCSGKDVEVDLQDLIAQVRKLSVKIFIVGFARASETAMVVNCTAVLGARIWNIFFWSVGCSYCTRPDLGSETTQVPDYETKVQMYHKFQTKSCIIFYN